MTYEQYEYIKIAFALIVIINGFSLMAIMSFLIDLRAEMRAISRKLSACSPTVIYPNNSKAPIYNWDGRKQA
jgi:hypothetical protein